MLNVKASVMSNFLFDFVKTGKRSGCMLRKRTDEVSRLSMRFALMHPHGRRMMFKWSDLGRLPEYLLIGLKRGMSWRVLVFNNQW